MPHGPGGIAAPVCLDRPRSVSKRGHRCQRSHKTSGNSWALSPAPPRPGRPSPPGRAAPRTFLPETVPVLVAAAARRHVRVPVGPRHPAAASRNRPGGASVRPRRPPANGKAARRTRHAGRPAGAAVKLVVSAQGARRAGCGRASRVAAAPRCPFLGVFPKRAPKAKRSPLPHGVLSPARPLHPLGCPSHSAHRRKRVDLGM